MLGRGGFGRPSCCYLSVTTSTPGISTGPPVLNRSPYGQEDEDDQEREIALGLVLRLLNFSRAVE